MEYEEARSLARAAGRRRVNTRVFLNTYVGCVHTHAWHVYAGMACGAGQARAGTGERGGRTQDPTHRTRRATTSFPTRPGKPPEGEIIEALGPLGDGHAVPVCIIKRAITHHVFRFASNENMMIPVPQTSR